MIAHLTADLMMASTAKATAASSRQTYQSFTSLTALAERLPDESIKLLVVDLQLNNLDLAELKNVLSEYFSDDKHRCVGYAQHVQVDLLEKAQECGFHAIMTRGQINSGMGKLFAEILES